MPAVLSIDGVLDQQAWIAAPAADAFLQSDPAEGEMPSGRTTVRVLAGANALAIGVVCDDPDPGAIVSFSVRRDANLNQEDHVRIVLGPFLDGRSGYVFAVNPSGARYDALVNPGDASENADWDGIWEAATLLALRDRLRAGGSERVPDAYRRQVSSYFEAIAVKKQP